MNARPVLLLLAALLLPCATGHAKPPTAKPEARPAATQPATPAQEGSGSLLRWLLLQDGGSSAAAVTWPEIVRVAAGRQVTPFEPAAGPDAATLAALSGLLDAALPRLNRPDGPLRAGALVTSSEITARIAEDLRTALATLPDSTVEPVAKTAPDNVTCPVLRWSEGSGRRTCFLLVAIYPAGGKEAALRALMVRAADLAGQIASDGPCLLVGVEHNGKSGRDLALLNWELIDLARVSLRCAVTFEADVSALHPPGATVADGRRGRD